MASVSPYTTKSGKRWRVQYRDPAGKVRSKRGFTRKSDAQTWADKNAVSVADGSWIDPNRGNTTVADLWPAWWASKQHLEPGSLAVMKPSWKNYVEPVWGTRRVGSIRKSEVQTWLGEHKDTPSTTRRAFGVLAGILDLAVEDGALMVNPARGVALPRKPEAKKVYYTPEQVWALVDECSQMKTAVALAATCGTRWGETVGVQPRDLMVEQSRIRLQRAVKDSGGEISVGPLKGHEARVIAVPRFVMDDLVALAEGLAADEFIFTKANGRLWGSLGKHDFFAQAVNRLVARGELPERITFHGLRHVAASLMVQSGASVKTVQRQLGHKSAALTLDTYAELFDGDLDEVAARMGDVFSDVAKLQSQGPDLRVVM